MISKTVFILGLWLGVSSLTLAAGSCDKKDELRFADGSTACAIDYKFFTIKRKGSPEGLIKRFPNIEVSVNNYYNRFAIATNANLPRCPISWTNARSGSWNVPVARFALQECNATLKAFANKNNIDASSCECEVIYETSINGSNVPVSKKQFEDVTRAWSALAQEESFFKGEFSQEEIAANQKFYADYKARVLGSSGGIQAPVNKLAEDKKSNNEAAKIAQKEKDEKEATLKKVREAELQAQYEKERKITEDKKAKDELARVAQQEKDQKELALRQRKEAELLIAAEKERKLAEDKKVKDELIKATQQANAQISKGAFVGKRLALVIGNAKYSVRPLDNPKNDADDISRALKNDGFEVIDVRDASLSQMRTAIRSFGDKLLNNDVGLVYYSGHGIEVKGRNYFIPVNADIKRADEIADQSIDVGLILDKMETAQKPVNILIVDACRDDPFGRSFRSGSRGLATMDAPQGTIIAFATSPGKVAADGDGRNSPYTKNLVLAMQEPNIPIEQVFKKVRRAVQQETKNQQTPWENTSLSGDFYFKVQK